MFQHKNLYLRLLSPNGTVEIGLKFEVSSTDVGFAAAEVGAAEQPFLTPPQEFSSPMPPPTLMMDLSGGIGTETS